MTLTVLDLLEQGTRNSERAHKMRPGALEQLLRDACRYRVDAVKGLLGEPFADFCNSTNHGSMAVGTALAYHGSLPQQHGIWLLDDYCNCDHCREAYWDRGEFRYRLQRHPACLDPHLLEHVHEESFDPLPA